MGTQGDPQGALAVVPASFCVAHAVSYVPSVKSVGCGPLTLSEHKSGSCVLRVPPNPLTRNGSKGTKAPAVSPDICCTGAGRLL